MRVLKPSILAVKYGLWVAMLIPFLIIMAMNTRTEPEQVIANNGLLVFFGFCLLATPFYYVRCEDSAKCFIGSEGVTFISQRRRLFLSWQDIVLISVVPDRYGRITKNCFIMFMTAEGVYPTDSGIHSFSKNMIGIQYRKQLPARIAQYTDMPIRRVDNLMNE